MQSDFDMEKVDDKLLLHMAMLKCADVSNGAKSPAIYRVRSAPPRAPPPRRRR